MYIFVGPGSLQPRRLRYSSTRLRASGSKVRVARSSNAQPHKIIAQSSPTISGSSSSRRSNCAMMGAMWSFRASWRWPCHSGRFANFISPESSWPRFISVLRGRLELSRCKHDGWSVRIIMAIRFDAKLFPVSACDGDRFSDRTGAIASCSPGRSPRHDATEPAVKLMSPDRWLRGHAVDDPIIRRSGSELG